MKFHLKLWPGFTAGFQEAVPGSAAPDAEEDLPFRAELYSAQQMAHHGRTLAQTHVLSKRRGPDRLLARLSDNARLLRTTAEELTVAVKEGRQITPASEWLLDNYYLIEEQVRIARRHLPKDYSKELPRLEKGAADGTPRGSCMTSPSPPSSPITSSPSATAASPTTARSPRSFIAPHLEALYDTPAVVAGRCFAPWP